MAEIEFNKMVNHYRKKNGWTMKELAEKMGKTESAVSKWESGVSSPKIKDINILSKILGVNADVLIFGTPKNSSQNTTISEVVKIMNRLDQSGQSNILNFAKFEYTQAEQVKQSKEQNASVS